MLRELREGRVENDERRRRVLDPPSGARKLS
jgi:hypothetical protein